MAHKLILIIKRVAFPDRRPSKDFNEPAVLPSILTTLSPPGSNLQKRRNSFDPQDEEEEEGPKSNFMAEMEEKFGSKLTSFATRNHTFGPADGGGELSNGGRVLGPRGRGNERRGSGVPVRNYIPWGYIYNFLCTDDETSAAESSSRS